MIITKFTSIGCTLPEFQKIMLNRNTDDWGFSLPSKWPCLFEFHSYTRDWDDYAESANSLLPPSLQCSAQNGQRMHQSLIRAPQYPTPQIPSNNPLRQIHTPLGDPLKEEYRSMFSFIGASTCFKLFILKILVKNLHDL